MGRLSELQQATAGGVLSESAREEQHDENNQQHRAQA